MHDDVTEITLINPKPTRAPSLWMNMATLILLFCLVVGAKYLSDRWLNKTPPAENMEKQIVMEDLENEKPIADSAAVAIPAVPEPQVAAVIPAPAPEVVTPKKIAKKKRAVKKVTKKRALPKKENVATATDPYTNGGPLDLDRQENQTGPGVIKQKVPAPAATQPTASPMNERDQLIPFEQ